MLIIVSEKENVRIGRQLHTENGQWVRERVGGQGGTFPYLSITSDGFLLYLQLTHQAVNTAIDHAVTADIYSLC